MRPNPELYGSMRLQTRITLLMRVLSTLAPSLTIARDLTKSPDRQCLHVKFDLSSRRSIKYQAGDHLVLWPQNSVDKVERLCRLLGLSEEERTETVDIKPRVQGKSPGFPPTTRKAILRHHLDISGLVSRDVGRICANADRARVFFPC